MTFLRKMLRRRTKSAAALVAVALAATACSSSSPSRPAAPGRVRVGLILDSPRNDGGWSQAGYVGMKALADAGLITLQVEENVAEDPATTTRVVTAMAESGVQLVVAHSFSYGDPLRKVARRFPHTDFAWGGGVDGVDRNVADYEQPFFQASYLEGILAGGLTHTGTIGGIAGFDIPACHAMIQAFLLGARVVRPSTRLVTTFTGTWVDTAKDKEAAIAQADQGADMLLPCGATAGTVQGARERGVGVMGYTQDAAPEAPNDVVASMIWHLDVLFGEMVADVSHGTFQPARYYRGGVREGALSIAINPAFRRPLPPEIRAAYAAKLAAIQSGAFQVPYVAPTP